MIFLVFLIIYESMLSESYFFPDDPRISYIGRFDNSNPNQVKFDWSGSTILFKFLSNSGYVFVDIDGENHSNYFNFFLDDNLTVIDVTNRTRISLSSTPNIWHSMKITKRTEAELGTAIFLGVSVDEIDELDLHTRRFLWLGDSLTTGYGDEGTTPNCPEIPFVENNYVSFDGIVSRHFDAYMHVIAWEGKGLVRNYGEKGHTSKKPLPYYLDWVCGSDINCGKYNFSEYQDLDALFVYLGANDFTSKIYQPTKEQYMNGYLDLIPRLQKYYQNTKHFFFVCGDTLPGKEHPWCDWVLEQSQLWNEKGLNVSFINNSNLVSYPEDEGCEMHPNTKGHMKLALNMISVVEKATGW